MFLAICFSLLVYVLFFAITNPLVRLFVDYPAQIEQLRTFHDQFGIELQNETTVHHYAADVSPAASCLLS